jgi:2-(1,2-epoxy-1,2-dihydrophenyl)acetyl-CoA isomerase
MSKTTLVRETLGSVAILTLNRPRQGNSLDIDLSRQLMEQAIACNCDPEIRAVILKAEGKFFCAGGDVPLWDGPPLFPGIEYDAGA